VIRHGEVESKVVVQICMQPYMLVAISCRYARRINGSSMARPPRH
jgi:hypothetical protein